jgi:hypothetical protein
MGLMQRETGSLYGAIQTLVILFLASLIVLSLTAPKPGTRREAAKAEVATD